MVNSIGLYRMDKQHMSDVESFHFSSDANAVETKEHTRSLLSSIVLTLR